MKRRVGGLALIAAVLVLPALPARGDDVASVQVALIAAQAKIHSFRIVTTSPQGFDSTAVIVRDPMRMHMQMTGGHFASEAYIAGGFMYLKIGAAAWTKHVMLASTAQNDLIKSLVTSVHMTPAADTIDDGVTYATVNLELDPAAPGAPPALASGTTIICTYDKRTLWMHSCKGDAMNQVFTGYNDPANIVTIPTEALNAPDVSPSPVPAPDTSPN